MQKDTRWNSERDALLFDPERNELNGKKTNIFTPREKFNDLAKLLLITSFWAQILLITDFGPKFY